MTLMLDPEVILTAVLKYDTKNKGVTYRDVRKCCDTIKAMVFADSGIRCVSFGIDGDGLQRCARDYPKQFHECCGRYYRGILYKTDLFSYRNRKQINQIIESAAKNS